ncbi:MAG: Jag N-terminal domain-containing protein [Acidimicrobiia bacterium]|nr:Jag N-terminal domain-containing protein [Acidimicrobiia bacterium]
MEWVETTGDTVEDARDRALDTLGVAFDDAEIEVITESKKGFLGFGKGEARVRARVRPTQPRPKADRRDRGRKGGRTDRRSGRGRGQSDAGGPGKGGRSDAGGQGKGRGQGNARGQGKGGGQGNGRGGDGRGRENGRPDNSKKAGRTPSGDKRSAAAGSAADQGATTPQDDADRGRVSEKRSSETESKRQEKQPMEPRDDEPVMLAAEQAELVEDFLDGLLDAFGREADLERVEIDEETYEVRVTGQDLGLLIGPKGNTLQAIQEVARTAVQQQAPGRLSGRVHVDVAGYRAQRRDALVAFTTQLAADVIESGAVKVLEPMSPADRKVVHDAAAEIDGVTSTSEGEEPGRRVVLQPAD